MGRELSRQKEWWCKGLEGEAHVLSWRNMAEACVDGMEVRRQSVGGQCSKSLGPCGPSLKFCFCFEMESHWKFWVEKWHSKRITLVARFKTDHGGQGLHSRLPREEAHAGMMVMAWHGWEVVRFWVPFNGRTIRISWRIRCALGEKEKSRGFWLEHGESRRGWGYSRSEHAQQESRRSGVSSLCPHLHIQMTSTGAGTWQTPIRICQLNSIILVLSPYSLFSYSKEGFFISLSKFFISKSQ